MLPPGSVRLITPLLLGELRRGGLLPARLLDRFAPLLLCEPTRLRARSRIRRHILVIAWRAAWRSAARRYPVASAAGDAGRRRRAASAPPPTLAEPSAALADTGGAFDITADAGGAFGSASAG
jgi:hypothetical protein